MKNTKVLLVTGGAGFIGSCFVRQARLAGYRIVILDALTYAGHTENLDGVLKAGEVDLIRGRIEDFKAVDQIFQDHPVSAVVNFAAESHVDHSIQGPKVFLETNIMGTFNLLEVARAHFAKFSIERKKEFRFVHVSTDEVFGELEETGKFTESSPYKPQSPYSASKAASDHLVRAWGNTYGLPVIVTNCSNNYGPRQFPEKLIPLMIMHAMSGKPLPVYGKGANIRDWIHVEDHSNGVLLALEKGQPGETYCFGGNSERTNLAVVESICDLMNQVRPKPEGYRHLIQFVKDRPGHDFRYAIDDSFAENKLGFKRKFTVFEDGLKDTIRWYLENTAWIASVTKA